MIETLPALETSVPLFVDLDGTLIRSDSLFETLMSALKRRPWLVFALPVWALRGRALLKKKIAQAGSIDASALPYNALLVERLANQSKLGRPVVLTTAADESVAKAVAAHLDIFTDVIASDGATNLKGRAKLAAIEAWRSGPFDYIGDSRADVPIWRAARHAVVVGGKGGVLRSLERAGVSFEALQVEPPATRAVFRALRPHQWAKNSLVLVPILAAHMFKVPSAIVAALVACVAFSLCASSVYVVNDLLDLGSDRRHPTKRRRPFASGELSIPFGIVMAACLLLGSFAVAAAVGPLFLTVLALYFALTLGYSLRFKRVVMFDIVVLAALYTMRVVAGYAATGIPMTFWLLAFAMFLFFGLAMLKRFSELKHVQQRKDLGAHGRGYRSDDLDVVGVFGVAMSCLAVLVMALYINAPEVTRLYQKPEILWGLVPILLYWISKAWLVAHRGDMHEDPVVFALTDRESLAVLGLCAAVATAASF
jgi:4-hydroxybenzoate polyprenyltransferase